MIDYNLLKQVIENNESFLLTTHVNPDADAIGSEVAMYHLLFSLNKKVYVINHSETPYNLTFLDDKNLIQKYDPDQHDTLFDKADVLVALDFNRSDRIVRMQEIFNKSSKLKICIDHHLDPGNFADHYFTDPSLSSTGEIIYWLIKKTGIASLTKSIAVPIYAAIMTDTGSFRFERTTPDLHRMTAELLEAGVIPGDIYDKIYDQSRFSKIKLLGRALETIQIKGEDDSVCYMILRQKDFTETEALESDTDGFVSFCLSVERVKVGLLFLELKNGFKVSFRSKGNIPVNKLAGEFGGGGHANAAGARFFDKKMDDFISVIVEKATRLVKQSIES